MTNLPLGANVDGCVGGTALGAWGPMKSAGRVTRTCDPYTGYAGVRTQRIVNAGARADTCGSHSSVCRSSGQRDLDYKVDKIFMMQGNDEAGIKAAIMEYGPVFVAVT